MSSCSSFSDRDSSSSPVRWNPPSAKYNWHVKVLAQQFSPTPKNSKIVQNLPRWSWGIKALRTAQQYLALVSREYRMSSNQDERGFATVTSTFFFFSHGHRIIQNTKSGSRGEIKPLCGHGQYSRMIFFYHVLVMYSDLFWLNNRCVLRLMSVSSLALVYC